MRPTILTTLLLIACRSAVASQHHAERDLLSSLLGAASTFFNGGDDDTPTSTTVLKGAPVTATQTYTTKSKSTKGQTSSNPTTTVTSPPATSTTDSDTITSTSATTTTTSESSSTSGSDTSTSTSSSSLTTSTITTSSSTSSSTPTPIPSNPANTVSSPLPSSTSNQTGISPAGIAVAVLLSLFIAGIALWVIFRHHPGTRAWWTARQEKRYRERSYRDALDGPGALSSSSASSPSSPRNGHGRKSAYLASFFAPRTVRLAEGKEIRRKPVQWGATGNHDTTEKVPLADLAGPMGRSPPPLPSPSHPSREKPLPRIREQEVYELA